MRLPRPSIRNRPRWPACRIGYRLVHPGEILRDYLIPYDISQNMLARRMRVPPRRINEIILGKRRITAETALGLGDALGPSAYFWLGLQADYDLELARRAYRDSPRSQGAWDRPTRTGRKYGQDPTWLEESIPFAV
jgi:addiction module HigA family antidote